MIKYYKFKESNKGFITHADQEIDNLEFSLKIGHYCCVKGVASKIRTWATRNKLVEVDAIIAEAEISKLESEVVIIDI